MTERRTLYFLFALSGAAALALEVVWTRWMVLAVGASSLAVTLVLAVFMAGLGLGALVAGRLGDARPERALALFAAAEGTIALWALLTIPLASRSLPALSAVLARAFDAPALPIPLRAALAILVLVPPTLMMGASLPLLARWAVSAGLLPGRSVGALYTANTLGGMAGTLLAVFLLIDRLGLSATVAIAALCDALVAAVALLVFRRLPRRRERAQDEGGVEEPPGARGALAAAAVGYFTSGFVGLALEVVSHRVMNAIVESSVYAFAMMLVAFLAGLAGGSFAGARWADRARSPVAWLGLTLGGLALGIGVAKRVFTLWTLPGQGVASAFRASAWSYAFELAGCLATLLPATLMLGLAVPLVARIAAEAPARMARRLGAAYALNTSGAVLGAVVAGIVLVPWLGTARALDLLALLAGAVGLVLVLVSTPRGMRGRFAATAAALVVTGLMLGRGADPVLKALRSWSPTGELLGFREGPVQAVAVFAQARELGELSFLRLVADQTSFAATHLRARRYMAMLGHLPVLWVSDPRSVLVICYGTGTTAGAVATHAEIERLDIAEISPEVIAFAPFFDAQSRGVLADPRVRLHVEDGRHIALVSRQPWDVITLEPPPPRDGGVVSLYSADFYRLCLGRLRRGGVVAQWCPLLGQSQDEIRTILRTFVEVFPHVTAFLPVEHDLILLGSDRPLLVDPERTRRRMDAPAVRESLGAIGFNDPADLLATAVTGRDGLLRFAGNLPLVTDDRPRLEYFARFGRLVRRLDPSGLIADLPALEPLVSTLPSRPLRERFERSRAALVASLRAGWALTRAKEESKALAFRAARIRPDDPYYLWAAGLSEAHLARLTESERARLRRLLAGAPD